MKHYSIRQLAKALGYSRNAVYLMVERGIVQVQKIHGCGWIVTEKHFNELVEFKNKARKGTRPFYGLGKGLKRVKQKGK